MARGVNIAIVMGRLGKDPEMRYTPAGKAVTAFSVAVDDGYTAADGEKVERTEWFNCEAWGKTAEVINQHLHKGDPIFVEGSMRTDKWQDKETNETKYRTKLVVSSFNFVPRNGGAQETAEEGYTFGAQE